MKMRRRLSALLLASALAGAMVPASDAGGRATARGQSEQKENPMKIRVDVEGRQSRPLSPITLRRGILLLCCH
jgi:hypothetical protein